MSIFYGNKLFSQALKLSLLSILVVVQYISNTNSSFSDIEISSSNRFTAGTWDVVTPTPGSASSRVVMNEIYYDVKNDDSKGTEDKNEWIELYNAGDADVNLKDWYLEDAIGTEKKINPNVTIPAKGFALLSHDQSTWSLYWDEPAGVLTINLTGSRAWLNNTGGETLALKNPQDDVIDWVGWGGIDVNWTLTAMNGKSISRKICGQDTGSPTDWEVLDVPTPGVCSLMGAMALSGSMETEQPKDVLSEDTVVASSPTLTPAPTIESNIEISPTPTLTENSIESTSSSSPTE